MKSISTSTSSSSSSSSSSSTSIEVSSQNNTCTCAIATTSATTTITSTTSTSQDIEDLHNEAVRNNQSTYIDPLTGYTVFTEYAHLKRGHCCGSMCRHCPYGWENVRRKTTVERTTHYCTSGPVVQSGDTEGIQKRLAQLSCHSHSIVSTNTNIPKNTNTNQRGKKNVPYTRKGDTGTSTLFYGHEPLLKNHVLFEALGTVDELCSVIGTVHAELLDHIHKQQELDSQKQQQDHNLRPDDYYGELPNWLLDIMSRLFDLESLFAKLPSQNPQQHPMQSNSNSNSNSHMDLSQLTWDHQHIDTLESWIDCLTEILPDLHSFILPTGGKASAQLHLARCVCRRAERVIVPLIQTSSPLPLSLSTEHPTSTSLSDLPPPPPQELQNIYCDPNVLKYINRLSDFLFTAARYTNYCEGKEEIQYKKINMSNAKNSTPTHDEMTSPATDNNKKNHQRSRVIVSLREDSVTNHTNT